MFLVWNIVGIKAPICAVSGAQYLTTSGWTELRNAIDLDVPFRLFRDEGRTFLQVRAMNYILLIFFFSPFLQSRLIFFFIIPSIYYTVVEWQWQIASLNEA